MELLKNIFGSHTTGITDTPFYLNINLPKVTFLEYMIFKKYNLDKVLSNVNTVSSYNKCFDISRWDKMGLTLSFNYT